MYRLLRKRIAVKNLYAFVSAFLLFIGTAFIAAHASEAVGIGDLAANIQEQLGPIETLIVALCYIGGIGFAGAAIMKFKQYKDNPQQIQLGQPIALTFVAAALIWLPQLIKTAGVTVFKSTSGSGGVGFDQGVLD